MVLASEQLHIESINEKALIYNCHTDIMSGFFFMTYMTLGMYFPDVYHCLKNVCIQSYSDPQFPAFGLNTDQNNSEYGHFLRSVLVPYTQNSDKRRHFSHPEMFVN